MFGPAARTLSDSDVDALLASPRAAAVEDIFRYTASGTSTEAATYLTDFAADTAADELILISHATTAVGRAQSPRDCRPRDSRKRPVNGSARHR